MLVLLDIDGVIVPAKEYKLPDFLADGFAAFSSRSVVTLNRLISDYHADIILTTSHKGNYSLDKWKALFNTRGIHVEKIQSLPVNTDSHSRKQEIINWFDLQHPVKDFLIIDDDKELNALPDYLKKNLVLTSPYVGLTEDHLEEIRRIRYAFPAKNKKGYHY